MTTSYLNKILRDGVGSSLTKRDKSNQRIGNVVSTNRLQDDIIQGHRLSSMPGQINDSDFEGSLEVIDHDQYNHEEEKELSTHTTETERKLEPEEKRFNIQKTKDNYDTQNPEHAIESGIIGISREQATLENKNNFKTNLQQTNADEKKDLSRHTTETETKLQPEEKKSDIQKIKYNYDTQKPEQAIESKIDSINRKQATPADKNKFKTNLQQTNNDIAEDQKFKNSLDIQELAPIHPQSKKNDRIPIVEIIQQPVSNIPTATKPDLHDTNSHFKASDKERQKIVNDSEKHKAEKQAAHQTVEGVKDSFSQLQANKSIGISVEPRPRQKIAQQDNIDEQRKSKHDGFTRPIEVAPRRSDQKHLQLQFHSYDESLKKNEAQIADLQKEIRRLNRQLEEYISKEQKELIQHPFLPQRPPSMNLGGWSHLERRHVR